MNYQTLMVTIANRVATVTINRPDKLNALNATAKAELRDLFTRLTSDENVHVVIITGAGDKSFVAGTDIAELSALNRETGAAFSAGGQEVLGLIENLGKPVIAAVNGYALGGGCELALACHIRIASDKAKFGQPEVNLGIIPGYGGTQRLPRVVGRGRALEMILSGVPIDAAEALRIGLVEKVVPHEELMPRARHLAELIASLGQVAVRNALNAVLSADVRGLPEGQREEARLFGATCGTEDFKEGIKAFLEKRKPVFRNT